MGILLKKRERIEKSYENLAKLIGIDLKQTGWLTRLAEWWDVPLNYLSKWKSEDINSDIPKNKIRYAEEKGYPKEKWYIEPARSNIEKHRPTRLIEGEAVQITEIEHEMIRAMRELDVIGRRGIYFSIMEELNEALREKRIKKDSKRKAILEKAIGVLKKAI